MEGDRGLYRPQSGSTRASVLSKEFSGSHVEDGEIPILKILELISSTLQLCTVHKLTSLFIG